MDAARVAQVIERVTGVGHHPGHVWRLLEVGHHPGHVWRLLEAMRWSRQRPAGKAVERNQAEIARWVAEEWPRIVQTPKRAEPGSASSTSRGQADPPVRRTWAPQGQVGGAPPPGPAWPAAVDVWAGGRPARPGRGEQPAPWMGFDLLEGADDTSQCIRVLDGLGHQPVTGIWDNLGAHHAGDLQEWAATQPWLELAYLPSSAPELDPVEGCGPT